MYKKAEVIRQIRKLMEQGVRYSKACEQVVRSRATIEFWRRKHPRLERYFQALIFKREEKITDAVEEKLYERLIKGEATPTEYIFYLCNRRPEKWKRYEIMINQSKSTKILIINNEKTGLLERFKNNSEAISE